MATEAENDPRTPRKEIALWVSIASVGIGVVLTGLKAASAQGKQEQRVDHIASTQIDTRARVLILESERPGNAVMEERVRRLSIDMQSLSVDMTEIKQLLQKGGR